MTKESVTGIEFVYFDLGNVLVAFDPSMACANVSERFGVTVAHAEHAIYGSGLQDRFEHGEISGEEYATGVWRHIDSRGDRERPATEELLDAVSEMFDPIESMRNTLAQVRDNQFRIGILSNTCSAHWEWVMRQSYGVLEGDFSAVILSFQVGSMKPHATIYDAAEAASNVPPERILFLDDRIENVRAARQRSWRAEQCLGGEQADAALRRHGVISEVVGN